MNAEQNAEKAKHLLRHYFSLTMTRWDSDNAAEVSDIVDHIIDACTPEAPAQPDALTRIAVALERIADRDAIAEYLHRAMSDFLQNTIKFQLRETPDGYVVEKEIVNAWWKAANTNYEDLDEDDKSLYICDADAIVLIVRVN